jgi:hypothetical protein
MENNAESWRDAALSLLFQQMSTRARQRDPLEFDETLATASVAQRILSPDVETISALSTLSPKAAAGALSLLDTALAKSCRADLFDDDARPRTRPRLLGQSVSVVFAETDRRCVVKVRSSGPVGRQAETALDHIVLFGGIYVERVPSDRDGEYLLCIGPSDSDDAAGGRPYFYCTCRAFEFKLPGEAFCKHVFAAGVAVASNLAAYSFVPDDDVVAMLNATHPTLPAAPGNDT